MTTIGSSYTDGNWVVERSAYPSLRYPRGFIQLIEPPTLIHQAGARERPQHRGRLRDLTVPAPGGSMAVGVITRSRSMRRRSARSTRNSSSPIWMVSPRRGRRPNSCISRPPIGVVFLVGKCRAEILVELARSGVSARTVNSRSPFAADGLIVLDVVLIVDLADDLLDDVLDGAPGRRPRRTHRPPSPCGCGCRRNSLSSTLSRLLSGTNTTGRMYSRISKRLAALRSAAAAGPWRAGCRGSDRDPRRSPGSANDPIRPPARPACPAARRARRTPSARAAP